MPRKKCPGGHFILGFCVWEDTFRGDTACTSLGVLLMVSLTTRSTPLTSTVVPGV